MCLGLEFDSLSRNIDNKLAHEICSAMDNLLCEFINNNSSTHELCFFGFKGPNIELRYYFPKIYFGKLIIF